MSTIDVRATNTTNNLNAIRWVVTGGLLGVAIIFGLVGVLASPIALIGAVAALAVAGLYYVLIGWFVDVLRVLVAIERNTRV
jgi:hypothetical protein